MTEGVVHGHEEPGVAAVLDQRTAGADRQRMRVVGQWEAVGEQFLPVSAVVAAPVTMLIFFFLRQVLDGERDRRTSSVP